MRFHHHLGHIGLEVFQHAVDQVLFELGLYRFFFVLFDFSLQIGFQFIQGVKFRNIFCKLIVDGGLLGLLHLVDQAFEHSGLAGQLFGLVVFGECDVHIKGLFGLFADHLVFKAGDEHAGAHPQAVILRFAAFKGGAVHKAFKVEHHGVVLLDFPVHRHQAGIAVRHAVQLFLHVFFRHRDAALFHRQALVIVDGNFRLDCHSGLKSEAFGADLVHIDLGMVHRLDLGFFYSAVVGLGIAHVDGIFKENAFAVQLLDDLAGRFALAEAGHSHFAHVFAVSPLQRFFKLFFVDGDRQLHLVLLFFLNALQLHLSFLLIRLLTFNNKMVRPAKAGSADGRLRPPGSVCRPVRRKRRRASSPRAGGRSSNG